MKKVVVLAGDGEYESHLTMKPVSERILGLGGIELDYRTSDVIEDTPLFPQSTFGGLEGLADAALLIMYMRFRVLPDNETEAIASYLANGGSILALRTSKHAFNPVSESPWFNWTSNFANDVLGSAWKGHHGHTSTTEITQVAEHPILHEVPSRFSVESWLYTTKPPADATVLLWGEPVNPEGESHPSPVAWVRELGTQRIFYTSVGGQTDLQRIEVLQLISNAAEWCLDRADTTRQ